VALVTDGQRWRVPVWNSAQGFTHVKELMLVKNRWLSGLWRKSSMDRSIVQRRLLPSVLVRNQYPASCDRGMVG